ncbi:MAG: LysM peptidoglycan-binding domain-containing protein, partial [Rhizobacter sp.]
GERRQADVSVEIADNATMALAPDAPPLRKMSLKAGRKDSVASVAKRYRVSPTQVAQWNGVGAGASFKPGQTIVVFVANKSKGGGTHVAKAKGAHGAKVARTAARGAKPSGPPSTRTAAVRRKAHERVARTGN